MRILPVRIPFLFLLSRALHRRSPGYGVAAGLVTGVMLAEADQVALLACYLLAGYVAAFLLLSDNPRVAIRDSLKPLGAGAVAGLVVVAVPLLLTVLFVEDSNRPVISLADAGRGSLHPASTLTLLIGALPALIAWIGARIVDAVVAAAGSGGELAPVLQLVALEGVTVAVLALCMRGQSLASTLLREADLPQAGVLHCFTEDWDMARAALDLGFYISLSGIVTFRNADMLREVARQVPADRLLVETDAPYLAPMPHRGKPNLPQYVRVVAEFLAELRSVPYATLAEQTTANFRRLFPLARVRQA